MSEIDYDDYDGQGKSLEEETNGAMRALVIAMGWSIMCFAAIAYGVYLWVS